MPVKKSKASELIEYRVTILEGSVKEHEENDKRVHEEIRKEIQGVKIELMKVVTKVAIAGSILGAVGMFMLQQFWKK